MTKFKVGDRIRRVSVGMSWAQIGYEAEVLPGNYYRASDGEVVEFCEGHWELVTHASPVREVTRKEIVPGAYGRVMVVDSALERVSLSFDQGTTHYLFTPSELREAANVFNQLADALEDGA